MALARAKNDTTYAMESLSIQNGGTTATQYSFTYRDGTHAPTWLDRIHTLTHFHYRITHSRIPFNPLPVSQHSTSILPFPIQSAFSQSRITVDHSPIHARSLPSPHYPSLPAFSHSTITATHPHTSPKTQYT